MRVGVFDSGVGGLTVVKSLLENNLFEEIIYYGDTARVPYGVKDKNTIVRYSLDALEFFKNFDIDMLICACNSVSAYAINELRESTNIPVVGVIEPGVLALTKRVQKSDKIFIIGTKATVNSKKYEYFLNDLGYKNIISKPTSLFVPIVEEGIFSGKVLDSAMDFYFNDIKMPDAIILGCTHFPLISSQISKYYPKAKLIHSGDAIVEYLKENFDINSKFDKTEIKYFATENPDGLRLTAKMWIEGYSN
jgi:glutamate racemase